MPMRFTLWNTGGDPDEYFPIAKAAEAAGWDSLCLNEGTFQPGRQEEDVYPYTADGSVNLAHLLVGAEGTLAVTKSLTLKLAPLPRAKVRAQRKARAWTLPAGPS